MGEVASEKRGEGVAVRETRENQGYAHGSVEPVHRGREFRDSSPLMTHDAFEHLWVDRSRGMGYRSKDRGV